MQRLSIAAAAILLTACGGEQEVNLEVTGLIGDTIAACGVDFEAGSLGASTQLADARVFLSSIEYRNEGGEWVALSLDQTSDWQHENVVLLDFEDGTAACADSGTPETNTVVKGTLPNGTYDAIRLDVGVPYALNHVNNMTAPPPLNAPGMFWTWQGGYKFVRVDFLLAGEQPTRWNVHVGSTGCDSDSAVTPPDAECSKPNRARIQLDSFAVGDGLSLDLAALVGGIDLSMNTVDTPPGCMSSPMEPADCTDAFSALGLDFETGSCVDDCSGQGFVEGGR